MSQQTEEYCEANYIERNTSLMKFSNLFHLNDLAEKLTPIEMMLYMRLWERIVVFATFSLRKTMFSSKLHFSDFWVSSNQLGIIIELITENGKYFVCDIGAQVNLKKKPHLKRKIDKNYTVDYLIAIRGTVEDFDYDSIKFLAVELDGHAFHEKTKNQAQHDKERDRALLSAGIPTRRYTGAEVYKNADAVLDDIFDYIEKVVSEKK